MNVTYPLPNPTIDAFLGSFYICCSVLGVPANMAALFFFVRQRKETLRTPTNSVLREHTLLFNTIYLAIVFNDLLIAATTFPVAEGFLSERQPVLFSNANFCTVWGVLWNVLPFYSVFLVLTMSITRSVILVKPKVVVRRTGLVAAMVCYLGFLIARCVAGLFIDDVHYTYTTNDQYCWEDKLQQVWYEKTQLFLEGFLLAFPILPIIISCLLSVYLICGHTTLKTQTYKRKNLQRHASITVILVTLVYIVLNFPSFLNFMFYIELRVCDEDMIAVYQTSFLWNYSWNLTYVLCVTINASINPVVYLLRIRGYRSEVIRTGRVIRNSVAEMFSSSSIVNVNRNVVSSIIEQGDSPRRAGHSPDRQKTENSV